MTIKKSGEKWLVDLYPNGRSGKRIRKRFDTKIEAQRFERYVLSQAHEDKEWNPGKIDNRHLSELIEIWFNTKGIHLKDGQRRRRYLLYTADWLGNPKAKALKPADLMRYIAAKKAEGISDKTLNNHLGYLNAVYNHLYKHELIDYENPLSRLEMIKLDERELSWLTNEQITVLLKSVEEFSRNPHVLLLTKLCLATGARWGEVEGLKARHVRNNKVTFINTKSGKSRSIPINNALFAEVKAHLDEWKEFSSSLSAFRRALNASGIELPKGQAAHVLRHSFASHFMMNGGNILTLQKVLGHASINMTMRYAHLSPDHLQDAIIYNPLANCR